MAYHVEAIWPAQSREIALASHDPEKENKDILFDFDNIGDAIFEAFADKQKRKIINVITDKPMSFAEIVKVCDIPLTSCFRKLNSLVQDGLITYQKNSDKSGYKKYKLTFESVRIQLEKEKIHVDIIRPKKLPEVILQ